MKKVIFVLFIFSFYSVSFFAQPTSLVFTPDSGERVSNAMISGVFVSAEGKVFLYANNGPSKSLYVAEDGLNFVLADINKFPQLLSLRIDNGDYIKFNVEINARGEAFLTRSVSHDGFTFTKESNILWNFPANDAITTTDVYSTVFKGANGGIFFIYLAGTIDNARCIYSPKNAPGMMFGGYRSNIFKDSTFGGGNNSYWDPHGILLPNGNLRVLTMNQHGVTPSPASRTGTVYSFTSTDNGRSWVKDPGYCLRYDDFTEFDVHSLNDPKLVRFPDGTFRIYVSALIYDASGSSYYSIVSATANPVTDVKHQSETKPSDFKLFNNYPNPFGADPSGNPTTTISYVVPSVETRHALSLQLIVYDVLGREVATLVNKSQPPGNYSVQFNAENLPGGIYFYTLRAGNFVKTKKMILLK